MAEKREQADPLEQIRAADAEAATATTAIREAQVADVIDTDDEVRQSELRVAAALGKEVERHQKVLAAAQEKKLKALESIDQPGYWANVWDTGAHRVMFYQCGYCVVDEQSEEAMKDHQVENHALEIRDGAPLQRDRNGVLLSQEG